MEPLKNELLRTSLPVRKINDLDEVFKFLNASMDESRIISQHKFAKSILSRVDLDDLEYFRMNVLKRELTGLISYDKQRDHAAHTVYNYILGYYFYENTKIKDYFIEHFKLRGIQERRNDSFGSLWPFVSLLHDIGYIFEGSIKKSKTSDNKKLFKIGAKINEEYFETVFWNECGIYSTQKIKRLQKLVNGISQKINTKTLNATLSSLRKLEVGKDFRSFINCDLNEPIHNSEFRPIKEEFPTDIVDIWHNNLKYYALHWSKLINVRKIKLVNKTNPFNRMIQILKTFDEYVNEIALNGYKGLSIRNIDHAAASGFMLMKISTFYHLIKTEIRLKEIKKEKIGEEVKEFLANEKKRSVKNNFGYAAEWWWVGTCWATMATAIHNIFQMKEFLPNKFKRIKITAADDPLSYLGILVDILQVWDRYTVSNDDIFDLKEPIENKDILIDKKNHKVILSYNNIDVVKQIKKRLEESLPDWKNFLIIKYHKKFSYSKQLRFDLAKKFNAINSDKSTPLKSKEKKINNIYAHTPRFMKK
jgi:hypothetical protein